MRCYGGPARRRNAIHDETENLSPYLLVSWSFCPAVSFQAPRMLKTGKSADRLHGGANMDIDPIIIIVPIP